MNSDILLPLLAAAYVALREIGHRWRSNRWCGNRWSGNRMWPRRRPR